MKMRGICLVLSGLLLGGLLLTGCEPSASPAAKPKVEVAPEWKSWPTLSSGPKRGYELRYNERAIPQRRVMVGEHNSIVYYKHGLVSYDIPKAAEWPREDLNDKSAYDQPRIAFIWANRENGDDYETKTKVWSKKLDGTDLRLVYDKGVSFGRDVVISPNGKYLAAISEDNEDFLLVDIATGEERKLNDFPGKTYFSWTSDSRYLFFGDFNAYKRFDVETNTIEDFSHLKRGMYMQFIGDKRVVVNAFGYQIYQGMTNTIYDEGAELLSDKSHINSSRTVPSRIMINPLVGNLKTTVNGGEQFIVDLKTGNINKFSDKSNCLNKKVLINQEHTYAIGVMTDYDLVSCDKVNWHWGIAENSRPAYGRPMLYNFQEAKL